MRKRSGKERNAERRSTHVSVSQPCSKPCDFATTTDRFVQDFVIRGLAGSMIQFRGRVYVSLQGQAARCSFQAVWLIVHSRVCRKIPHIASSRLPLADRKPWALSPEPYSWSASSFVWSDTRPTWRPQAPPNYSKSILLSCPCVSCCFWVSQTMFWTGPGATNCFCRALPHSLCCAATMAVPPLLFPFNCAHYCGVMEEVQPLETCWDISLRSIRRPRVL